ncbi:MAG: hypothetical protein JXR61_03520 [Prolixibacteraceae bacterium]|nr:hypothetical protein [Prolixibacteraceae bacterium]
MLARHSLFIQVLNYMGGGKNSFYIKIFFTFDFVEPIISLMNKHFCEMKSKLILAIFLTAIVLLSCSMYSTYTVKNETKYNLVIYGYRMGLGHISFAEADPIYIEPYSEQNFLREVGEDNDSRTFFSVVSVDSAEIIFNNEKKLVLSRHEYPCPDCHSILQGFHLATITEEDYNNAVPINK